MPVAAIEKHGTMLTFTQRANTQLGSRFHNWRVNVEPSHWELSTPSSNTRLAAPQRSPHARKVGQYHCNNRRYDINQGRWTSPDQDGGGWSNLVDYCNGCGVCGSDPSGLTSVDPGIEDLYRWYEKLRSALARSVGPARAAAIAQGIIDQHMQRWLRGKRIIGLGEGKGLNEKDPFAGGYSGSPRSQTDPAEDAGAEYLDGYDDHDSFFDSLEKVRNGECIKSLEFRVHGRDDAFLLGGTASAPACDVTEREDTATPAKEHMTIREFGRRLKPMMCYPCVISFSSCSVGAGQIAEILAQETGCRVIAPKRACYIHRPIEGTGATECGTAQKILADPTRWLKKTKDHPNEGTKDDVKIVPGKQR